MTGYSNDNSFGASAGNSIREDPHRPVPPWKFGVGPAAMSTDRGGM